MADWEKMKAEYLTTDITIRELAQKYGVHYTTIGKKAAKEDWQTLRQQQSNKTLTKILTADTKRKADRAARLMSVADKLTDKIERYVDGADVITPNLTEANLLLGRTPDAAVEDGEEMGKALSDGGRRSVVITGISPQPELVGAAWYDRTTGTAATALGPRVAAAYPGTGDLFAAVLTGGLVRGEWLKDSVMRAVSFVQLCARHTRERGLPGGACRGASPARCWRGYRRCRRSGGW